MASARVKTTQRKSRMMVVENMSTAVCADTTRLSMSG
jgi:hypothetical protein